MAAGGDAAEELRPAEDAPEVDFEPAEAEPGEDPTRVQPRINLGGTGDQAEGEDDPSEEESPDAPGKMPREKFASMSIMIWAVPGRKDERLKPLAVTQNDDPERIEGAMACGRALYDLIKDWAPWLLPPDIENGGNLMAAGMFLWGQKQIYDQILHDARAEAARDVSPEGQGA